MSDHNFEKQVQQKLDELKIRLSDNVWTAVQVRIRRGKRRRRGLILLPLLLLLLAGGGYLLIDNYATNTKQVATVQNQEPKKYSTENQPANQSPSELKPENSPGTERDNVQTAPITKDITSNEKQKPSNSNIDDDISLKTPRASRDLRVRKSDEQVERVMPANENNRKRVINREEKQKEKQKEKEEGEDDKEKNVLDGNEIVKEEKKKKENVVYNKDKTAARLEPTADNQAAKIVDSPRSEIQNDSIAKEITVPKGLTDSTNVNQPKLDSASQKASPEKKRGFTWGVIAGAGSSSVNRGGIGGLFGGIFDGQKSMATDVASSPSNSSGNPITRTPSPIKNGFSFNAGLFVQKKIAKRISVSSGLQYNQFTHSIMVGDRIDSSGAVQNAYGLSNVSGFYQARTITIEREYVNRFHFLELPLNVHIQLNRSRRFPLAWSGGLSLSYLLSTNALHFDSNTGLYYKDNSLFNKWLGSLSTGFSVGLFNSSRLPVHVGPEVQYGFSRLMKENVKDNKHLFYLGVSARVFLKK